MEPLRLHLFEQAVQLGLTPDLLLDGLVLRKAFLFVGHVVFYQHRFRAAQHHRHEQDEGRKQGRNHPGVRFQDAGFQADAQEDARNGPAQVGVVPDVAHVGFDPVDGQQAMPAKITPLTAPEAPMAL